MNRLPRWPVLLTAAAAIAAVNVAERPRPAPAPTGKSAEELGLQRPKTLTVNQDGYKFDIELDPTGNVSIYTLGAPQPLPRSMAFSLLHDPTSGQTTQVQTVPPDQVTDKPGEPAKYSGNISNMSNSYFAAEIQIPLPSGEWKRLEAKPKSPG